MSKTSVPRVCPLPKLSKDKKKARIQIAKDVLKLIDTVLNVKKGTYGNFTVLKKGGFVDKSPEEIDLRTLLVQVLKQEAEFNGVGCEVCAKGAVFIAHVLRFDKLNLDDVNNFLDDNRAACFVEEKVITKSVSSYFRKKTLDQIEDAFEAYCINGPFFDSSYDKALASWQAHYPYAENRLAAIMKNIIRNDGTFKFREVVPPKKRKKSNGNG